MCKNNLSIQVDSLEKLTQFNIKKIVAAIGVFDGIHLGHQEIIKELIKMSKKLSATPVVITFFPHPRKVLYPHKPLRFLRTPAKKAKIMGNLGIKAIVTVPFSLEFAALAPDKFIEKFMHPHNIKLAGICVGAKWRFGAKGRGNEQTLHSFADKCGFVFKSVNETHWNGKPVSSTAIRSALAKGDFSSANYMLNKKYIVSGHVLNFDKLESNNIVNVKIDYGVLPPIGQYTAYINNNRDAKIELAVVSLSMLRIMPNKLSLTSKEVEIEFIQKNPTELEKLA